MKTTTTYQYKPQGQGKQGTNGLAMSVNFATDF